MTTTNREKLTLCLEATLRRFPKPKGFKGLAYDEGLKEIRQTLYNLPDAEIDELIRDYRLYLLG